MRQGPDQKNLELKKTPIKYRGKGQKLKIIRINNNPQQQRKSNNYFYPDQGFYG
jgi:hypothetical protein